MAHYKTLVRTTAKTDNILSLIDGQVHEHDRPFTFLGDGQVPQWDWRELKGSEINRRTAEDDDYIHLSQTYRFKGRFRRGDSRIYYQFVALVRLTGVEYVGTDEEEAVFYAKRGFAVSAIWTAVTNGKKKLSTKRLSRHDLTRLT